MSLPTLGARLVAVGLTALPGLALAVTIGGYLFVPAPVADRGKLKPIADNPAYGYTYLHEHGWYIATLPRGGRTDPTRDGSGRTFDIHTDKGVFVCSAAAHPRAHGRTFEQLQAQIGQVLTAWEREVAPAMTVQERGVLELKDDGEQHVKMAAWTGLDGSGSPLTLGVIEVPKGTLLIGCTGSTTAQSKFFTQMVFRLAEGAL